MGTTMTIAEQNHILEALAHGFSVSRIAATMNRRPRTIQRMLQKLADSCEEIVDAALPPSHIVEDREFKKAMLAAIRAGKEHALIGVVVDTSPIPITTRFYSRVSWSMCGSPAASCAEIGDNLIS